MPPVTDADRTWMRRAIELSTLSPPASTAFSVGAVVVGRDGVELASGYSRESDGQVHAEESALAKLAPRVRTASLKGATIYSTLEPCSQRRSRPRTCAELILASGLRRVVIAWREPALLVDDCQGVELLGASGVVVEELADLAAAARAVNAHLFPSQDG
ncbi:deaminase [Streptomyces mayteni]